MSKRLLWIAIPIAIVPYLALLALATIFLFANVPFFQWIMETVFCNNALYLVAALFVYCILVIILTAIWFFVSIHKKLDPFAIAKTAMIIKLAQIPAYVLIYAIGVLMLFTIFTIPFTIGLFLIDCLAVFMTGLLVIASVVISIKNNHFLWKEVFWIVLLQFIFCGDVIASVFLYRKLKRIYEAKLSDV